MLKQVHSIVHPFFHPSSGGLFPYYKELTQKTKKDPSLHLNITTIANHSISPELQMEEKFHHFNDRQYRLEHMLLKDTLDLFRDEPERLSLFVSTDKDSPFKMADPPLRGKEHPWFTQTAAERGPESFISSDFSTVFHRWRENECRPVPYHAKFMPEHVEINGKDYIKAQINPELAKILRRLKFDEKEVEINNETKKVFDNHGKTWEKSICGHGTLLAVCVLDNTVATALTLGLPLINVEISGEQYDRVKETGLSLLYQGSAFPFRDENPFLRNAILGWSFHGLEQAAKKKE